MERDYLLWYFFLLNSFKRLIAGLSSIIWFAISWKSFENIQKTQSSKNDEYMDPLENEKIESQRKL